MSRVARARRKGTKRVGARSCSSVKVGALYVYKGGEEGASNVNRQPFDLKPPIVHFAPRPIARGKRRPRIVTWSPLRMSPEELERFNRIPVDLPPSPPGSPVLSRRSAVPALKTHSRLWAEGTLQRYRPGDAGFFRFVKSLPPLMDQKLQDLAGLFISRTIGAPVPHGFKVLDDMYARIQSRRLQAAPVLETVARKPCSA